MTRHLLARLSARLLRAETYALIAAPALADAQHEAASASTTARVRNGFALGWTLMLAALGDLCLDLRDAFALSAAVSVWARALVWYVGIVFLTQILFTNSLALYNMSPEARIALSVDMAVSSLPLLMAGAAFGLARRRPLAGRSIASATLVVCALCFTIAMATSTTRHSLVLDAPEASHVAGATPTPGARPAPLAPRTWDSSMRTALTVPAWALLGASLSVSRGWMVPVRVLMTVGGWFLLVTSMLRLGILRGWPQELQRWRDLLVLLLMGVVSWALTARARRTAAAATILLAFLPGTASAQTPATGRVVAAETGAALPRARIAFTTPDPLAETVLSDDQGRFVLTRPASSTGIPISISASKAGYATASETFAPGQSPTTVTLRLTRGASVNGLVTLTTGEPAVSVLVAIRPETPNTPPRLTETDDLGQYRFGGLPAGRYTVVVLGEPTTQRAPIGQFSQRLMQVPTPTLPAPTTEPQRVDVAIGEDKEGVDILLQATAPAPPRQPPANLPSDQRGTATVSGRVTSAAGRPLAGATVRVSRTGMVARAAVTDRDGRYTVGDLPDGSVTVEASRTGYVTMQFGQPGSNQPGKPVTLRADETTERIDITLIGGSALTGTIVDDHGEPVEGVTVRALQLRTTMDVSFAVTAPNVRPQPTDDRGRFRVWGVMPGRYLVSASADAGVGSPDPRGTVGFAPTYYPGTTDLASATTVRVDPAIDLAGIDLTFIPSRTYRVSGFAFDAAGQPARGVLLFPSQRSSPVMTEPRTMQAGGDGAFTFTNVPPGEFVVQVMTQGAPASTTGTPSVQFGMQYVTVTDGDPAPVTVRATAGSTIEGRIVFDKGTPPPSLRVWPFPSDFDRSPIIGSGPAGLTLLDDGAFRVTGVSGPRRFVLMGGPEGAYLKSASVHGADALDQPFDFGSEGKPFTDIEVVVGTDSATLTGRVANDRGEPVPDYSVLVFVVDSTLWYRNAQRVKLGRPNQEGSYRIMGLPPGDYFAAAVVGLEGNATGGDWQNPRFLESLAKRAQRITLGPSETRTLAPRVVQP